MGAYDDIIDLPHPTSTKHPRMPMAARLTDQKMELTEDEKAVLDEKLCLLNDTGGEAVFTYFLPDEKKDGGAYVTAAGSIKKLDLLERRVVLTGGAVIPVKDILEIEGKSAGDDIFAW